MLIPLNYFFQHSLFKLNDRLRRVKVIATHDSCSYFSFLPKIQFASLTLCVILGVKRFLEALKETQEGRADPDTHSFNGALEESRKSVKSDIADSDNASVVNSASSPQSKSSEQLKEKESPAPDTDLLASEEFVLLDCQASKPTESLASLIGTLRHQIRSSDWLEKNTPELSAGEDPEILDVFKALLQRAKK